MPEACPQKLPIPELLKAVTSEMEGRFFDTKLWFFGQFMNSKDGELFVSQAMKMLGSD